MFLPALSKIQKCSTTVTSAPTNTSPSIAGGIMFIFTFLMTRRLTNAALSKQRPNAGDVDRVQYETQKSRLVSMSSVEKRVKGH